VTNIIDSAALFVPGRRPARGALLAASIRLRASSSPMITASPIRARREPRRSCSVLYLRIRTCDPRKETAPADGKHLWHDPNWRTLIGGLGAARLSE
jgi:hypothetical protein